MKMTYKVILAMTILTSLYFAGGVAGLFGVSNANTTVVLSKSNTIVLNGEVDGESVGNVIAQAKAFPANGFMSNKPLYLFLNTPGGGVQNGLELIEALNGIGRPVHTVTLFAASMGFQLVQNLGQRYVLKNGVMMSHRAQGQFAGYFGGKQGSQIDSRYGFWLNRLKELDMQTVKRTNGKQTLESYQKAYADELWLTGQEAVDGGYADKVVTLRCDSSLNGVTTHQVEFLGMHILFDIDNCPLNTSPMNVRVSLPEEKAKPLTGPKADSIKEQFLENYSAKQRSVVPMYW